MFSAEQPAEIMFGLIIILAMFKQTATERKQKQMKFEKVLSILQIVDALSNHGLHISHGKYMVE